MGISRPVIAFALLKECSEILQTDLLGGISLLIRPIINDLGGQRFSAETLSKRIADSYGLAISPQVLTEFLPRFIAAGLVLANENSETTSEVVFANVSDTQLPSEANDEQHFQEIFDQFLKFSRERVDFLHVAVSDDDLISGLLTRLASFDFRSIETKPDRTSRDKASQTTIAGPTVREDAELERITTTDSKLDMLVASFVGKIADSNPAMLELLVKVAEGALGAELVFDLQAPKNKVDLSKVSILLDSPLLLSLLDLSDKQQHSYAEELFDQICKSKATVAAFRHSVDEAEGILDATSKGIRFGRAYGPTAERLRDRAFLAYFETMKGAVERRLIERGIRIIEPTSVHHNQFFSGEELDLLTNRLQFHLLERRLARERDALSVSETIKLRAGAHVPLEQIGACKYMFITANPALQINAREFLLSRKLISKAEFSPIITDRYFAGLAWLLLGGVSDKSLPKAKLLANCTAALRSRPDVISRTRAFLTEMDAEKAGHFEILMTKERAARYLTELVLGDSLLITAENADEIYEKVEAIAAEKVAKQKDEFYGALLEGSEKQIQLLDANLEDARASIDSLVQKNAANIADINYLNGQQELLRGELDKESEKRRVSEREVTNLGDKLEALRAEHSTARQDAIRLKKAAIARALKSAKSTLWLVRVGILLLMAMISYALGYCDKFIIPKVSAEHQDMANYLLICAQVLMFAFGFWVFTDKLFGGFAWNYSKQRYREELEQSGYEKPEPEFAVNFEEFEIVDRSPVD